MFFDDNRCNCHSHFWEDVLMLHGVGVIIDKIMDGNKKPRVVKDYTPSPEQMEETKDFLYWIEL